MFLQYVVPLSLLNFDGHKEDIQNFGFQGAMDKL